MSSPCVVHKLDTGWSKNRSPKNMNTLITPYSKKIVIETLKQTKNNKFPYYSMFKRIHDL